MNAITRKPLCEMTALPRTIVRAAREEDAGRVLTLFLDNLAPIAHFKPDLETVGIEIFNAIAQGRIFVAIRDDEIIGCAAYAMLRPWYLAKPQMWDQGIFVLPEYRKTRVAYELLQTLEAVAAIKGCTLILSANTKNEDAPAVMRKRYRKIAEVFVVRE